MAVVLILRDFSLCTGSVFGGLYHKRYIYPPAHDPSEKVCKNQRIFYTFCLAASRLAFCAGVNVRRVIYGSFPNRKGHSGQFSAGHSSISFD